MTSEPGPRQVDQIGEADRERVRRYINHRENMPKWVLFMCVQSTCVAIAISGGLFTRDVQLFAAMPMGLSVLMIGYHTVAARFIKWRAVSVDPSSVVTGTVVGQVKPVQNNGDEPTGADR